MWPAGTEVDKAKSYIYVKTPMIDSAGKWTVSIVLNDKPDYLLLFFEDEAGTRDNNYGNYWFINSLLKAERISVKNPTFAQPLISMNASTINMEIKAPATATNWYLALDGVGDTIEPTVDPAYSAANDIWTLTFTAPSQIGLYDVNISASINGHERYDWEPNSLKLVDEIKSQYKFVVIADPQFHRDGSAGYAYRNEETGLGNFTDVLKELNILNPEFILCVGDLTEWTDEVALLNYRKWCDLYLDNIPIISLIGNHGDFEGTASTGVYEWGSGQGIWENIIGPTSGIFYYGTHAFIRGDSHSRGFNDAKDDGIINYNFVMSALDQVASADMKFLMLHHPLAKYGNPSEEVIQSDTERNAIISKLQDIGATAHFHGHLHADKYDKTGSVHQIGTTEAVGDNPGYRVVNIANNEMMNFSYVSTNATAYYAPSNPIGGLKTYYQLPNDGTQAAQAVIVQNCFSQSYKDAHMRFYLKNGPIYEVTGAKVHKSFVQNGIRVFDVLYDIGKETFKTIYVSSNETEITLTLTAPACLPITVPPPPIIPKTTTTTTTVSPTIGFLLLELLIIIGAVPLVRKRGRP
jgi:hypothetical protein